ncbi:MAG: methyltransferase domain-containing protein [Polyangiaceae bacterium]|nr:methyltransferase domain-containing protein [Polyangiaceae bacterium]
MILDRALEVVRDRINRSQMSQSSYWSDRVRNRTGDAKTVWHSESFNKSWHQRQVQVLENSLRVMSGGVKTLNVLDVGCGTGRITRELHQMGAAAVGVDFSPAAIEDASRDNPDIRFEVGDIANPPLPFDDNSFDVVVSVGCLAVACKNAEVLEQSMREISRITRLEGAVVLLEPIHSSMLLARVLKANVSTWVNAASKSGLRLIVQDGMGFVPLRLAFSSIDFPSCLVDPVFQAGESVFGGVVPVKMARRLADYTLLGFRRADR